MKKEAQQAAANIAQAAAAASTAARTATKAPGFFSGLIGTATSYAGKGLADLAWGAASKTWEYGTWPFRASWNLVSTPIGEISTLFKNDAQETLSKVLDPEYMAYQTGYLVSNDYIIDNLLQENVLFRSKIRKALIRIYLYNLLKMHNKKLEHTINQLKNRLKLEKEVEEKISKLFENKTEEETNNEGVDDVTKQ
jgi:hypothetical protein